MRINGTARIREVPARHREETETLNPSSRALVVRESRPAAQQAPRRGLTISPHRRACTFLAHLTLQYNSVADKRLQRAERLKTALSSYGAEARARRAPPPRHAHDLTI